MKNGKKNGYVAPIVVTILMLLYFVVYFGLLINLLDGVWKYALAIIPLAFAGVLIHVCIERIKEIRSNKEDDLSKY
ncbi:MAG: hypothetical protein J6Q89_02195 [Clostridia bacterium]|nr:hypothetical protein [Clostridia bacterium]